MATYYIKHITKYNYSHTVIDGANLIRLHPINDEYQEVKSHYITVTNNAPIQTFTDFYKNQVGTFMITEPINELYIESEVEVTTTNRLFPEDTQDIATQWNELKTMTANGAYYDFLKYLPFSGNTEILELLKTLDYPQKTPYRLVLELCQYIYSHFKYTKGITHVNSSLEDVWKLKAGVCQDFTHIFLQMVRMCGIPARYVSGYICPANTITRGEGATHAWIEAYIPFYGWLGVDPTNNAIANENHVRLAVGRNYADCAPVKGVFKGKVESRLLVKVEVSTTKNKGDLVIESDTSISTKTNNSYQRHVERIQQQQQQ